MTKFWRTSGAVVQALVLGVALALALARLMKISGGIAVFKYQGF